MSKDNGTAVATQLRRVITEDSNGYKHSYLLSPEIADEEATQGLLSDPPDLEQWDWDAIRKELHNKLVVGGFFTYRDVNSIDGFRNLITSTITNKLVETYKLRELS